jgi:hypothetical protein
VSVNQAEAAGIETMALYQVAYFADLRDPNLWQQVEQSEGFAPLTQPPESKFRNDEWVYCDLRLREMSLQGWIAVTKMIDPNRGIGKDHLG